jgi:opacity protein-like surface antigen
VKHTLLLLSCLALASPAAAQDPPALSIRPFVLGAEQMFAAGDTFDAVFDTTRGTFFGGGVQVVVVDQFVIEVGASRFKQTGERVFRSGAGSIFRLGIPLTATITPLEITGGYRFPIWERVRPYVAAGVGSFAYRETSDFADDAENVDARETGLVVNGGAEVRLHRWIGVAADVQYSRVRGILGGGGISQQFGDNDLGGVSARFKFIVGR